MELYIDPKITNCTLEFCVRSRLDGQTKHNIRAYRPARRRLLSNLELLLSMSVPVKSSIRENIVSFERPSLWKYFVMYITFTIPPNTQTYARIVSFQIAV